MAHSVPLRGRHHESAVPQLLSVRQHERASFIQAHTDYASAASQAFCQGFLVCRVFGWPALFVCFEYRAGDLFA